MARMWARQAILLTVVAAVAGCGLFEEDEERLAGERIPVRATAEDRTVSPSDRAAIEAISQPVNNPAWPQVNAGPTRSAGHLAASGALSPSWTVSIGSGATSEGALTAAPVVADGRVYTLDGAATVSAFSTSGALSWRVSLAPEGEDGEDGFGGGLAWEEGRLFVTTGFGETVALNAASGEEIWRQRASAPIRSAPAAAQGVVVVVTRDNNAFAYGADDGAIRWRVTGAASAAGVLGGASPAISRGGSAILPFGSGELIAVRANSGRRLWSDVVSGGRRGFARSAISDISSDPVIQGVAVIAGNASGLLVAIDGRSGRRGWTREFGAVGPVWTDGQTLFVVTDDAQLKRLSTQDGGTLWSTALPEYGDPDDLEDVIRYGGPVLAGGRVLVTSSEGVLYAFDPISGAEVGRTLVSGLSGIGPVVAGGAVYVLTDGGSLISLR